MLPIDVRIVLDSEEGGLMHARTRNTPPPMQILGYLYKEGACVRSIGGEFPRAAAATTNNVIPSLLQRNTAIYSPGALCEYRYSGTEASFEPKSWSCGMGDPSLDRHSGVCRPLVWGDSRPG